jgi:hypothetical protein
MRSVAMHAYVIWEVTYLILLSADQFHFSFRSVHTICSGVEFFQRIAIALNMCEDTTLYFRCNSLAIKITLSHF